MRRTWFGVVVLTLGLLGCGQSGEVAKDVRAGAYLGEGKFHGAQGSLDAKVQLELHEDGSYQMLWLAPSPMMLFGVEDGGWAESGGNLVLTPVVKEAKEGEGTFAWLSAASSKSAQPKTLERVGNGMKWSDGKMDLVFKKKK